eukprot:TRINITY_DN63905_c0_g1_i1.p1 TRINITY_DN63905_c0_g1~~TRINITY_DN63905_c0_g1_i1.p1  ORF type:complete len:148 (-),score=52.49 TRINITY_DN63905_c0_g1_i1:12-455(-)
MLNFDGDRCVEVVHIGGEKTKVPEHVVINQSFSLHENDLDHTARVELAPSKIMLVDLFAGTADFLQLELDKKPTQLKALASKVASDVQHATATTAKETVSDTSEGLQAAKAKRSTESLEKAKLKIEERKRARTESMKVKLVLALPSA